MLNIFPVLFKMLQLLTVTVEYIYKIKGHLCKKTTEYLLESCIKY